LWTCSEGYDDALQLPAAEAACPGSPVSQPSPAVSARRRATRTPNEEPSRCGGDQVESLRDSRGRRSE
jgi:hypothetical protein